MRAHNILATEPRELDVDSHLNDNHLMNINFFFTSIEHMWKLKLGEVRRLAQVTQLDGDLAQICRL